MSRPSVAVAARSLTEEDSRGREKDEEGGGRTKEGNVTFPREEEEEEERRRRRGAVCVEHRWPGEGARVRMGRLWKILEAEERGGYSRCFLSMVVGSRGVVVAEKGMKEEVAAELFVCREQGECRREEADQDVSRVSLSRDIRGDEEEDVDVRPVITTTI